MANTKEPEYVARIPFGYSRMDLDIGQIFSLENRPNDERLIARRYMEVVEVKDADVFTCDECGGRFVYEAQRRAHVQKRHPKRMRTPEEEDLLMDREDRQLTNANLLSLSQ